MTLKIPFLRSTDRIVDDEGRPLPWVVNAWNDMVGRLGGQTVDAVATATTQIAATSGQVAAITNGTQTLADVVVASLGSVRSILTAQGANLAAVAATSGGLTVTASPPEVFETIIGGGLVTLGPVALTITGGTSPYTVAWADDEALGVTITAPTATTTTITVVLSEGELISGSVRARVTDAAATVVDCRVAVTAFDTGLSL